MTDTPETDLLAGLSALQASLLSEGSPNAARVVADARAQLAQVTAERDSLRSMKLASDAEFARLRAERDGYTKAVQGLKNIGFKEVDEFFAKYLAASDKGGQSDG